MRTDVRRPGFGGHVFRRPPRLFLLLLLLVVVSSAAVQPTRTPPKPRTFEIDYEKNEFLKDGEVFRYVSGSLHYFRIPKPYWKDRIKKMKAAGLNAITTYVEWSLHEPSPGVYNFKGNANFEYFMKLIKDENMYLILRPGPYICAERDFGGFPYWLLNVVPKTGLRTYNSIYREYVSKWFSVLMPKVQPYLYGNGGNIIMVQVENEYGSYYTCDSQYKLWIRDLFRNYVGNNAVLFTIDGCGQGFFECGPIPEVYATVDFGISDDDYLTGRISQKPNEMNAMKYRRALIFLVFLASGCFELMTNFQKGGPFVNSEFYPGWLSHWQEPLSGVQPKKVVAAMKAMLALNASFSFYMFHGGTNFGFTSGANTNGSTDNVGYLPQLTSYDYDAPLDEAGDPTQKYFMIQDALKDANLEISNEISPVPAPKGAYGVFRLRPVVSIFEKVAQRIKAVFSDVPLTFEAMDINTGFVLYETVLKTNQSNLGTPVDLTVNSVRDRSIIYLNQVQVGTMNRLKGNTTISLNVTGPVQKLSILVENQGRINYGGFLEDRKGIDRVTFGNQSLGPWKMIAYPLNETSWLSSIQPYKNVTLPAFFSVHFTLPKNYTTCLDTYLDTSGWTKGVAFINDINLGRYWPVGGPQVTLYVPAPFLKPPPAVNTLVMFELESAPRNVSVKFVDKPILNGPITV